MLFSASYTTGYLRMGDSFYYIKSQLFCPGLGLGAMMFLFSRIDHRFLRRMVGPGYVVCLIVLVAGAVQCAPQRLPPLAAHRRPDHTGLGGGKV